MVIDTPPQIEDEIREYAESLVSSGDTEADAEKAAMNRVRQSGWYKTARGWKQLAPDVRDKVNLRKAFPQPDGRYAVEAVDVFYANAVKGHEDEKMFTQEDIVRAVKNTNKSLKSGGQAPALAVEHPHVLSKLTGVAKKSYGRCVGWTISPRGKDWVRCNIVDIDPEIISEWGKGRYTGLSAGFTSDANDLNLRFGHVALLGVESQALSHLPVTEIFSSDTLCFCADSGAFQNKEKHMDRKAYYAAMKSNYSALANAFASCEAGETGADSKLGEAFNALKSSRDQFAGEMGDDAGHPDAEQDKALIDKMVGGGGKDAGGFAAGDDDEDLEMEDDGEDDFASQEPQEKTPLADPTLDTGNDITEDLGVPTGTQEKNNGAPPSFSARDARNLRGEIKELHTVISALKGRQVRADCTSFCASLTGAGHQFDSAQAIDLLISTIGNPDAHNKVKGMLKNSPKNLKLSKVGSTFSAGEDGKRVSAPKITVENTEEVRRLLNRHAKGVNFSDSDIQIGMIVDALGAIDNDTK